MSDPRRSILAWALDYVGDPRSHQRRGEIQLDFLVEEGLRPEHRVLDVGCGALSAGVPLMRYLDAGNYVGLDVAGWLVEAALTDPLTTMLVEEKQPSWQWRSDFAATDGPYDMVFSHSVLSHVAHWQLDLCLTNIRKAVNDGAIFLASLRLSDTCSFDTEWVYPANSVFSMAAVEVAAWQAGWRAEHVPDYKRILTASCQADVHDWTRFTAQSTPERINDLRVSVEERRAEHDEIHKIARDEYKRRETENLRALEERAMQ